MHPPKTRCPSNGPYRAERGFFDMMKQYSNSNRSDNCNKLEDSRAHFLVY
jgi:hypothetical protein